MPSRYATPAVRNNLKNRISQMEECERTPQAWEKITDKATFKKELARNKAQLEAVTPPDLPDSQRANLSNRVQMLETAIREGKPGVVPPMTTEYQEWKVPSGTIGQRNVHEQYWKTHTLDANGNPIPVDNKKGERGGIFEVKDLRRVLYKEREDEDPDVANVDMIRRRDHSSSLADTRLPRSYGLSEAARANYDQSFPDHPLTPVEQKITAPKKQRKGHSGPTCAGVRTNGKPCNHSVATEGDFCKFHQKAS